MSSTSYNLYYQDLKRRKEPFDCPVCDSRVHPGQFEKHCGTLHGVDSKRVCVWCREYSWPAKTKKLHYNHLRSCFVRFMNGLSTTTTTTTPAAVSENAAPAVASTSASTSVEPTLLSMEHLYPERADVDKLADPSWSTLDFNPTLLDLPLPALRFQDGNLNLAIACVQAYLETRETHAWFHVMVRGVVLSSFLTALMETETTRTLPFSCWCDGGPHEARFRQHRHFIVVSPSEERFRRDVWNRVHFPAESSSSSSSSSRPPLNYPVKRLWKIDSPRYLVNTLGYVSHPRSSCRFVIPNERKLATTTSANTMNHFHLYKTLPENYRLPLVLQWDGGVAELLYQEKLQNVSVTALAKSVRRIGSRWGMELGLFYGLERGKVLPVEWRFLPTPEPTSYFLHLTSGRKLYFFLQEEEMRREDWLRLQAEGGNVFYDAVAGDVWHPRKRDQKFLNQLRPLMDQVEEMKDKIRHLEENEGTLERQVEENKQEIILLKRHLEENEAALKRQVEENVSLKRQLEENKQEIVSLKRRLR